MKARSVLIASAAFVAACSGNVQNDEVVLTEGVASCSVTRGADVCGFLAESKLAVRDDIAIVLQRSSMLAMRSHDVLRRAKEACDNIARDLGRETQSSLDPTPQTLDRSCESAATALRLEMATTTLRADIIEGSCPRRATGLPPTCASARDEELGACTPATMELVGGETSLRARKTLEKNLLTLVNAREEAHQIADAMSGVLTAGGAQMLKPPHTPRDTACTIPFSRLTNESSEDIRAVATSAARVVAIVQRPVTSM